MLKIDNALRGVEGQSKKVLNLSGDETPIADNYQLEKNTDEIVKAMEEDEDDEADQGSKFLKIYDEKKEEPRHESLEEVASQPNSIKLFADEEQEGL